MSKEIDFLKELAELQKKYGVNICTRRFPDNPSHSQITFQGASDFKEINTLRTHSSAHEINLIALEMSEGHFRNTN